MSTWAIILAAGQGARLARAGLSTKKQFLTYRGAPLYWRSALTFSRVAPMSGLVFVFPPNELEQGTELTASLYKNQDPGLPWQAVGGGPRRQDSVFNGLQALPEDCAQVLVHDAARPFFSPSLVVQLLEALALDIPGAIPALPVKDTIKTISGSQVTATLNRSELVAVQTPQAFDLAVLRKAHEQALAQDWEVTDDASMVERLGLPVVTVAGEEKNAKITTMDDLALLEEKNTRPEPVTGYGYDVHRFAPGDHDESVQESRPMKLGGVLIPGARRVLAHSDGDVLLHALTDALLGCLGQGDIGQRFPDTDPAFENMESALFVKEVLRDIEEGPLTITHVDLTVIAQTPKLSPHRQHIRRNIAHLLDMDINRVNLKATTEENLGFTGRRQGIKAVAVVSALRE